MYDVIVIGAGPGGSTAAKRCAQYGLKVLLLEKRILPRHKLCGGMIMSRGGQSLVKEEFGEIPQEVLSIPQRLSGLSLHVVGTGSVKVEHVMPFTWRKDLDYWMNQTARKAGVEIRDNARVTNVIEVNDGYTVVFTAAGREEKFKAKFVIGADGSTSVVRKSLFPEHKVKYWQVRAECYQGSLNLEKEYFHFFYIPDITIAPIFDIHHKGDFFIIDVMAMLGALKRLDLVNRVKEILASEHGFDPAYHPIWTDSCLQPLMHKELVSGLFFPCKGNVILVGEAAGLLPLLAGEGIGEAIWSGSKAANSVIKAMKTKEKSEKFYMHELAYIIQLRKDEYSVLSRIKEQAGKGNKYLLNALKEIWVKGLNASY